LGFDYILILKRLRYQHEQLRSVIIRVINTSMQKVIDTEPNTSSQNNSVDNFLTNENSIDQIDAAYSYIKDINILDLSQTGDDIWESSLKIYEEKIDKVEGRISLILRDQLGTAKSSFEMFKIFSKYNSLFVRPQIRGAIREYQTQLIQKVKIDIETLHKKFKMSMNNNSNTDKLAKTKDIPTLSSTIIRIKQIERQLCIYLKRVEEILGDGWQTHIDGQKLKQDGDNFKLQLNTTQSLFNDWSTKIQNDKNFGINGKLFSIISTGNGNNNLKLKVNFSIETITLAKEVKFLKWLGYRIPLSIVNKAHQANQIYPYAISLLESIALYQRLCDNLKNWATNSKNDKNELLISNSKKEMQSLIQEGTILVWESYKIDKYVTRMLKLSYHLQERVDDLFLIDKEINDLLSQLSTCSYDSLIISDILEQIQKYIDELTLKMYTNLPVWIESVDKQIEKIFSQRLEEAVKIWINLISLEKDELNELENDLYNQIKVDVIVHEIVIKNQVLFLNPPLETSKCLLFKSLHNTENVILNQQRIIKSDDSNNSLTFKKLIHCLPDNNKIIYDAYTTINDLLIKTKQYIDTWLQFQSLWDIQPEMIYNRLGEDINLWILCLSQIK
jgi:dynein heavy chain 1, cytosolic